VVDCSCENGGGMETSLFSEKFSRGFSSLDKSREDLALFGGAKEVQFHPGRYDHRSKKVGNSHAVQHATKTSSVRIYGNEREREMIYL
jgi:hypothetical protein